jgi:membrane-associated phospholipid phosphatase
MMQPFVLKISKIISDVFNPLTAFVVYFAYQSSLHHTFKEAFWIFLPIFLIIIIPIIVWIFLKVKTGKYTDKDVSNRNQRKSLYFVIAGIIAVFMLYDWIFNENFDVRILFILMLLVLLQISNYFIKSSMHTAFNVLASAFLFELNPVFGIVWFIIAIVVGITRIILKRHSLKEVLTGGFIAFAVSLIYILKF